MNETLERRLEFLKTKVMPKLREPIRPTESLGDVARETGLHRNTVSLLYQETATRIELVAIDALCAYFRVGVSDLFEFVPESPTRKKT